jgi:hypothetical protein
MLLANVVLMAQLASNSNAREVTRPCADESALCRISPFFCPGTYPQGMDPCWPDGTRQTRNVGSRGGSTQSAQSAPSRASAPAPAHTRAAGGNAKVRKFSGD